MSNIILQTLEGRKTDRVPVAPFINVNYVDEFFGQTGMDPVEKTIEVYDRFGFDIIFRNSTSDHLNEKHASGPEWHVQQQREDVVPEKEYNIVTTVTTPQKVLRQVKQYRRNSPFEIVEAHSEYFIKDEDDFRQFVKYQPPVPEYDNSNTRRARELLGKRGCIAPWVQGVFNMVSMYRKLDDLLVDAYVSPHFYNEMMDYFSQRVIAVLRQYKDNGAEMVSCGGNVAAGGVVGASYFKEYICGHEAAFFAKINDMGLHSIYHNCGDAAHLMPLYESIGMHMYESLTPPPYGDTDLAYALETMPKHITLSGGFDQITLLREGTPDQIDDQVKKMMSLVKKRGNFIMAATDYFNENTSEEKVDAFAQAARKYGEY